MPAGAVPRPPASNPVAEGGEDLKGLAGRAGLVLQAVSDATCHGAPGAAPAGTTPSWEWLAGSWF